MYRFFVLRDHRSRSFAGHAFISLWALSLCCSVGAFAQRSAPPVNVNAPFSVRVTHLLGLPNTKTNCNGTLSIQDNLLQFRQKGKPGAQVSMASVRNLFLGEESKQVGGLPMKLGKTAAPYGTGRVVSLFAHKEYDTLTLEYIDSDGGVHGAIFQLRKGQGELLRDELLARGVSPDSGKDQPTRQSTAEVTRENK
jgi:hypothetical protein